MGRKLKRPEEKLWGGSSVGLYESHVNAATCCGTTYVAITLHDLHRAWKMGVEDHMDGMPDRHAEVPVIVLDVDKGDAE